MLKWLRNGFEIIFQIKDILRQNIIYYTRISIAFIYNSVNFMFKNVYRLFYILLQFENKIIL